VTILLDVDPTTSSSRMGRRLDRLERAGADFHRRTREAYLARAEADPARWIVVDAAGSREDVQRRIRAALADRLPAAAGHEARA